MSNGIFPKKDRPWLDGSVCIILGFFIGLICGGGIGALMVEEQMKERDVVLQKLCADVKGVPEFSKDGWLRACALTPEVSKKK